MSEERFTYGPWSFSLEKDINYVRIYPHDLGRIRGGDILRGYCGEANAHLIVAAPDLYKALQYLVSRKVVEADVEYGIAAMQAKAALAKARGEVE